MTINPIASPIFGQRKYIRTSPCLILVGVDRGHLHYLFVVLLLKSAKPVFSKVVGNHRLLSTPTPPCLKGSDLPRLDVLHQLNMVWLLVVADQGF